jgi:signal transduction histidine kinase
MLSFPRDGVLSFSDDKPGAAHGGKIGVEPEPGQGATFYADFPLI